ncbi:hypothetical protein OGAPHI_000808 [Ogataea philodendri]|uniref:Class E vacuolar protein-sorting machinery protein HSE1 n=1 Tax=Ogataea philodendri TaxID=1378263 RepID=A0A9P8PH00_9ASCO|nr:uncharacterized protein OGAPHI_000808 [Ogataea philodendri]KAH3671097.1 hypothetical protein OGAPHI_000808 [Ogataea philodendri]
MSLKQSIDKATSSELTEDNLALLLDVVDIVKSDADTNIEESVEIIKTKLESNNANVILRSVSLLDFLAENCGAMMRAQIGKRSFVNNYLVKLVNDPKMHNSIKYAIIKEIYKLSKSFKGDESLRAMELSFAELKTKYLYLCQQAVSEVDGTARPAEGGDEDEELKKAIEMSLKETGPPFRPSLDVPTPVQQPVEQPQPEVAAPVIEQATAPEKVRALYDLVSNDDDTLSFKKDDIIVVVENVNEDWIRGCLRGNLGIVPVNYVEKIPPTTDQQLAELTGLLDNSLNVEVLLSKLIDLRTRLASQPVSSQEFESILIRDEIPGKLDQLTQIRGTMKQILDLYKLKVLELQSMQENIDTSVDIYEQLLRDTKSGQPLPPVNNTTTFGFNPQQSQYQVQSPPFQRY